MYRVRNLNTGFRSHKLSLVRAELLAGWLKAKYPHNSIIVEVA
jgi:hypothetical protein